MRIREYNDWNRLREETDFGGVACPIFILDHMRKILENPNSGFTFRYDDEEHFRILDGGQDIYWTVRFAKIGCAYYGIISTHLFGQPMQRMIGLSEEIVNQWIARLDQQK